MLNTQAVIFVGGINTEDVGYLIKKNLLEPQKNLPI